MSTQTNRAITRRYFEDLWNRRNLAAADEIVSADVVGYVAGMTIQGRDTLKQRVGVLYRMYSDPQFTVEDQIAEDDRALVRWTLRGVHSGEFMGAPPTGKTVTVSGMNLFRLAEGRIVEIWVNADDLGELQQLGVIPAPQAG